MKVKVDETLCTGHGRCYSLAPEVYSPDEEGYNSARGTAIDVPPDKESGAWLGITNCPEGAISLVED
jgi:ferredoxin